MGDDYDVRECLEDIDVEEDRWEYFNFWDPLFYLPVLGTVVSELKISLPAFFWNQIQRVMYIELSLINTFFSSRFHTYPVIEIVGLGCGIYTLYRSPFAITYFYHSDVTPDSGWSRHNWGIHEGIPVILSLLFWYLVLVVSWKREHIEHISRYQPSKVSERILSGSREKGNMLELYNFVKKNVYNIPLVFIRAQWGELIIKLITWIIN